MEDKIIRLAESLANAYKLKEELCDKDYWIQKAAQETDFVPDKDDWIHIDVTLFKIEISVHHSTYGGAKYWKNGVWCDDPFSSNYPSPLDMITEMQS